MRSASTTSSTASPLALSSDQRVQDKEDSPMTMISRRQFLGSAAGAAALGAVAHVTRQPAWAQNKEIRVLAWSHFVPAYDKWYDGFADQWGAKNGVKVTIDHVPHLQI